MAFRVQAFDQALSEYQTVRSAANALEGPVGDEQSDDVTERLDHALERLLKTESPSFLAFRKKLRVLELEYGREWQPRHVAALLTDAAVLRLAGA